MEKTKRKVKWVQIITAILLCVFCAFSFAGCGFSINTGGGPAGPPTTTPGTGDNNENKPSNKPGTEGGGTTSPEPDGPPRPSPDDVNDVFAGIIGVYEGDDTTTFADAFAGEVSFSQLASRQLIAFSTYILTT